MNAAKKQKRYKWGFLGYGQVAREHMAGAVLNNVDSELFAVASQSHYQDSTIEATHRFSRYEDVINHPDIDIVYIALPNTMHVTWTIKALQAGKHVLCEKPIAMTVAEVEQVIKTSAETGYKVMEGFMYRYSNRMKRLEEVLATGQIGEITYIQSNFFSLRSRIAGIRADASLGGGSLWDLGCYPVSLIIALFGAAEGSLPKIQTMGTMEKDIDTYLSGNLGFSQGKIGTFSAGWISDVRDITTMIIGSRGIIEIRRLFNWAEGSMSVISESGQQDYVLPAEDPFAPEVASFLSHIEDGTALAMPLTESKYLAAVMQQIGDHLVS
jgi:predicted dehydrogenase